MSERLAVDESVGAAGVEAQQLIADDLEPDPADICRLTRARAAADCR